MAKESGLATRRHVPVPLLLLWRPAPIGGVVFGIFGLARPGRHRTRCCAAGAVGGRAGYSGGAWQMRSSRCLGSGRGISFTLLAAILAALAVGCSVVVLRREGIASLRVPAMLVSACSAVAFPGIRDGASQWDEFSHWLPSAKFLLFHDGFPGIDAAETELASRLSVWMAVTDLPRCYACRAGDRKCRTPWLNLMMLLSFGVVILDVVRRTVPGISELHSVGPPSPSRRWLLPSSIRPLCRSSS